MRAKSVEVMSHAVRRLAVAVAVAVCFPVPADSTSAQQSPASARKQSASQDQTETQQAEQSFRVFKLKHAVASEVQPILMQLAGRAVAVDQRTNSILVQASADVIDQLATIMKLLDVPAADRVSLEPVTRIFMVKNIVINDAVEQQLRVLLSPQGRMAVDSNRNSVVAQDTKESLEGLEALIRALDVEPARSASAALRIRIVWLVAGMEREDAAPPPADLKGVIDDLAKIGVEGLKLAAQTIVHTVADERFEVRCRPELDNRCELTINGALSTRKGASSGLQIEVRATEEVPLESNNPLAVAVRQLCYLSTTIFAPPGHTVVLGATPVGKMTSVFVVRVSASE